MCFFFPLGVWRWRGGKYSSNAVAECVSIWESAQQYSLGEGNNWLHCAKAYTSVFLRVAVDVISAMNCASFNTNSCRCNKYPLMNTSTIKELLFHFFCVWATNCNQCVLLFMCDYCVMICTPAINIYTMFINCDLMPLRGHQRTMPEATIENDRLQYFDPSWSNTFFSRWFSHSIPSLKLFHASVVVLTLEGKGE